MMKKYFLLTLILLGACSWRSPNAEFYMLNSRGLQKISNRSMNIAVTKVSTPDILNRQQMVTFEPQSNRVNILEFNRWGENLPYVLQNTVTNDLLALLPNSYIKRVEYDSDKMRYNVRVDINQITAYPGEKALLSAWWTIENAEGGVLKRRQATYEAKTAGNSIADLVAAQNQTVNMMSREIAESLLKL